MKPPVQWFDDMPVAVALSLVRLIWDNSWFSYSRVQYISCKSAVGERLEQTGRLNLPAQKGSGGLTQQCPEGREGEERPS